MTENEYTYLGHPHRLLEGGEKVAGGARYVADLQLPGLLHARPLLSPHAHARILSIDTSMAEAVDGVVAVLTAADLPTRNRAINSRNSAVLARGETLWVGQPVAVVVGEDEAAVSDALDLIFIDYEPLPAVADLASALAADAPVVWPRGMPQEGEDLSSLHADTGATAEERPQQTSNIYSSREFTRGDVAAGLATADVIIENSYRMEMVHQGYLEPHAAAAVPDPLGTGVTVYTSTQGKFTVRSEVAGILGLDEAEVEVVPMTMGGGFGAKYGILEPLAAAVALALNRPVRIVFSRSEDFLTTTPAPEIQIQLKTGATRDGTLVALDAEVHVDNGVFRFGHGGIIAFLLGGYYKCPNLRINTHEVNTNRPQVGAYRAPGVPQATFALESNIDELARALDIDPLQFRRQNAAETGDPTGTGRPWPPMGLGKVLDTLAAHPLWQQRRPGEGVGIAIGGWPTNVGPSEATIRVDSSGLVHVQTGHVDVTGNATSFALIAAETIGVAPSQVRVHTGSTNGSFAPGSGGSQVTYSLAGAVRKAAAEARTKLLSLAEDHFEAAAADIDIVDGEALVRGVPDKRVSVGRLAQIGRSRGGGPGPVVAHGTEALPEPAPAFTAHLVKVRVNEATGEVQITDYLAIQDVGFALNPLLVEGQIHGGIVQGIGMALREALVFDSGGQLLSGSFMDYGLPRMEDVPRLEIVLLNNPSEHGAYGMRGIGEPPIIPGAAAIGNAIRDAVGTRLTELPMRPERVWRALQAR